MSERVLIRVAATSCSRAVVPVYKATLRDTTKQSFRLFLILTNSQI